jgi:hypothetical protein
MRLNGWAALFVLSIALLRARADSPTLLKVFAFFLRGDPGQPSLPQSRPALASSVPMAMKSPVVQATWSVTCIATSGTNRSNAVASTMRTRRGEVRRGGSGS